MIGNIIYVRKQRNFDSFFKGKKRCPLFIVEASPISSLPLRRVDTERQGFYLRSTLHAHLLDSHFMLFALNCSLRSSRRVGCTGILHPSVEHTRPDQFDTFRQLPRSLPTDFSTFLTEFYDFFLLFSTRHQRFLTKFYNFASSFFLPSLKRETSYF